MSITCRNTPSTPHGSAQLLNVISRLEDLKGVHLGCRIYSLFCTLNKEKNIKRCGAMFPRNYFTISSTLHTQEALRRVLLCVRIPIIVCMRNEACCSHGSRCANSPCSNIKEAIYKSPHQYLMHIDEGMQART